MASQPWWALKKPESAAMRIGPPPPGSGSTHDRHVRRSSLVVDWAELPRTVPVALKGLPGRVDTVVVNPDAPPLDDPTSSPAAGGFSPQGPLHDYLAAAPPPGSPGVVRVGHGGPAGKPRSSLAVILLGIVTLGIYTLYWQYASFEELKDHTGQGIGGGLALVLAIFLGIVNVFLLPSEIGDLYQGAGRARPVSGWTGLWVLLPFVGGIVWVVKTQGALNRYWESC